MYIVMDKPKKVENMFLFTRLLMFFCIMRLSLKLGYYTASNKGFG